MTSENVTEHEAVESAVSAKAVDDRLIAGVLGAEAVGSPTNPLGRSPVGYGAASNLLGGGIREPVRLQVLR